MSEPTAHERAVFADYLDSQSIEVWLADHRHGHGPSSCYWCFKLRDLPKQTSGGQPTSAASDSSAPAAAPCS